MFRPYTPKNVRVSVLNLLAQGWPTPAPQRLKVVFYSVLLLLSATFSACTNPTQTAVPSLSPVNKPASNTATATGIPAPAPPDQVPTVNSPVQRSTTPTTSPTIPESPLLTALQEISTTAFLADLQALTNIQAYSGWRSSATEGELEALDYIADRFSQFDFLLNQGLEIEHQNFDVFLSTEMWATEVTITLQGEDFEVPANGIRGNRYDADQAVLLDSDGGLNDSNRDPVTVTGQPVLLKSNAQVNRYDRSELPGKIVLLAYQQIQPGLVDPDKARELITYLLESDISALILITSSEDGNGRSIGGGKVFEEISPGSITPIVYMRLEDLQEFGIEKWSDLLGIESIRVNWDTDIFVPGKSGNLVVKIPGRESSKALVIGAHIDSANTRGQSITALIQWPWLNWAGCSMKAGYSPQLIFTWCGLAVKKYGSMAHSIL